MSSRVEYNDVAAVRWAVQLLPDLILLNKFEDTEQG
jgi:hypothetical protein